MSKKEEEVGIEFGLVKVKEERPDPDSPEKNGAWDEAYLDPLNLFCLEVRNSETQPSSSQNETTGMEVVTYEQDLLETETPVAVPDPSSGFHGVVALPLVLESMKQAEESEGSLVSVSRPGAAFSGDNKIKTQPSVPQNVATGMGSVIKQELPESPVAGPSSNCGFLGIGPFPMAQQKQPEESVRERKLGAEAGPRSTCKGRKKVVSYKHCKLEDNGYCYPNAYDGPTLGSVGADDLFNLDLTMSLDDANNLDFQFDELASLLDSTPGYTDNSLIDLMRKDPLAAFNLPSVTPEKVLQLMETDLVSGAVEYVKTNWRRISIGTYRVGKSNANPNFPTDCIISRYGFYFSVRHTNLITRHQVKVCIPITDIMAFKTYNGQRVCVMCIQTGSAYAAWLRSALGMELDQENFELQKSKELPSLFYGPLLGDEEHKWIIMLLEHLSEADFSKLQTFFMQSNGKDFLCDFQVMNNTEAKEFVLGSKIHEWKFTF